MAHEAEFVADEVQSVIKSSVDEVLPVNEPYVVDKVTGKPSTSVFVLFLLVYPADLPFDWLASATRRISPLDMPAFRPRQRN